MSIIFSRQCEYALQAVLYLAVRRPGSTVSIKEISKSLKIPLHFLAKIFQDLSKKKILTSTKGPKGGFSLARPAAEITLLQIVEAIDGVSLFESCILGFPQCSGRSPCAVHGKWGEYRENIKSMLEQKSIGEMAPLMAKKPEYRINKTQ